MGDRANIQFHDPISFSNYIETILDKDDPWRTLKGRHGK
jgi:hypothetical protein